jgi:hypothetical protein
MKYLQYTKYVSKDGTGTICLVPLSKAIHLPVQFQEDAVWYELLSSELLPYLIHRYAPIMTFIPTFKDSANPLTKSTYTDLYDTSYILLEHIIKTFVGVEEFKEEIAGYLQSLDELEIKCRQEDLYQSGRVDY